MIARSGSKNKKEKRNVEEKNMIVDNISNGNLYFGVSARMEKALKYLQQNDFTKMDAGKYEIDGNDVFALVQKYDSKPIANGVWEAHRNFIDVQYVADGAEQMGYAYLKSLNVSKEYDPAGDYLLLEGKGIMLNCQKGTFAVFGPEDAHMPCIAIDAPQPIVKVVVKVRV
jgi:YhcH/YjgK/YiaL family protein